MKLDDWLSKLRVGPLGARLERHGSELGQTIEALDALDLKHYAKPDEDPGCGHHGCPVKPWRPPERDPRCVCGKPMMLCVRPGEHVHPCPVHPEYVIVGQVVTC